MTKKTIYLPPPYNDKGFKHFLNTLCHCERSEAIHRGLKAQSVNSGLPRKSFGFSRNDGFTLLVNPLRSVKRLLFGTHPTSFLPVQGGRTIIKEYRCGFTLAETLITLVIIGVVAALTVPTLMNKIGDRQNVVALKKAYSELNQAFNLAQSEQGKISTWDLVEGGTVNHEKLAEILKPYFKLMKICPANESPNCFAQTQYKRLDGTNWINGANSSEDPSAQMIDGKMILFEVFSYCGTNTSALFGNSPATSRICGNIFVDINGAKKPNVLGRDVFTFYLSDYGVVPRGSQVMEMGTNTLAKFSTNCSPSTQGYSCAAWVLYNENMDYLHCDDLSWSGKHKC